MFIQLFVLIALAVILLVIIPLIIVENNPSKNILGFYYNEKKKQIEKPFWVFPLYSGFFIFFQLSWFYFVIIEYRLGNYNFSDLPIDIGLFLLISVYITAPLIGKTIKEYKLFKNR